MGDLVELLAGVAVPQSSSAYFMDSATTVADSQAASLKPPVGQLALVARMRFTSVEPEVLML